MSEFDVEAARQLVADIGLRPAARHYRLNHATLASRIRAHEKTTAPLEAEPWRTIRRHENETRKQSGLRPLTDKEWQTEKQKTEECQRANEQLLRNSND